MLNGKRTSCTADSSGLMKVACLSSALRTALRSDFLLFDTRVALRHCISIVLNMYGS